MQDERAGREPGVGVGPHPDPWPDDPRLDPDLLAGGDRRNVADGYRCVAGPMAEWPGEAVLVVGGLAQSVGLYAVAAAIALGAPRVVYIDHDPERLRLARHLGADALDIALDDLVATEQFAVTVDACVLDAGRDHALRSTRPCGTCTSVSGGAAPRSSLPLQAMYLKGIRYEIGRVHARATAEPVLDLVVRGLLDPQAIVTRTVGFADAAEAMAEPDVKIVFTNDG